MKIKVRKKIDPIHVRPSDTLTVTYDDGNTIRMLVRTKIDKKAVFDEVVIFEDEFEGRYSYGRLLVEQDQDRKIK
jgi:hypothetical protein